MDTLWIRVLVMAHRWTGTSCVARGTVRFIAESLAGEKVGLQKRRNGKWRVHFGAWLMGELRENERGGMRPVVYQTKRVRPKV